MDSSLPAPPPQHQHAVAALRGRFSSRLVSGFATIDLDQSGFPQRLVHGLATVDLDQSGFPQRLVHGLATIHLEQIHAPPEADQRARCEREEVKSFAQCLNLPTSYDSQLSS